MWLNEFKTGDIVEDKLGNVVEIKQIFKTGNVKIKILKIDSNRKNVVNNQVQNLSILLHFPLKLLK